MKPSPSALMWSASVDDAYGGIWYDREDGTPVRVTVVGVIDSAVVWITYDRTDDKGRYRLTTETFKEAFTRDT